MDPLDRFTLNPSRRSGQPCIRNLRMTVYDVLDYLEGGTSEAELLVAFPDLTAEDVRACHAFSAERARRTASVGSE